MCSLWGAAGFYEPAEESELVGELRRLADEHRLGAGGVGLKAALHVGAGELLCFIPPSRYAERVPYTLEGDLVAVAQATWSVRDPDALFAALQATPELSFDGETEYGGAVTFDWLASRRELLARRRAPLPAGALCVESGPVAVSETGAFELNDLTSLGTFTLYADRLEFFAASEARLDTAIALVARRLKHVTGACDRSLRSYGEVVSGSRAERAAARPAARSTRGRADDGVGGADSDETLLPDARMRELTYRRWIDDPNQHLGGLTPRQAAGRREYRDELDMQLRGIEHSSARTRADRRPGPEVSWLRGELRVENERLAA